MDPNTLATVIANMLGAAEMLNAPAMDAQRLIEKVLGAPNVYATALGLQKSAPSKTKSRAPNCF
jgi:hypothetical protein